MKRKENNSCKSAGCREVRISRNEHHWDKQKIQSIQSREENPWQTTDKLLDSKLLQFSSRRHKHGISWYQTPKNYVVWLPNSQNSSMTKLKNGQLNPNKEHTENYWCVLQGSRNSKINIILNCNHRRSSGIPSMKSTAQIHHRLPGNRTAQSKIEDYTEWSKYPVQMKRNMRQYACRGHIGFHD